MDIEIKLSEWSPAASMARKAQASAALDLNFRDLCYSVGKGIPLHALLIPVT